MAAYALEIVEGPEAGRTIPLTHPVELDVEFLGTEVDAFGNTRIGYEASTEISRKQWGVDFNVPLDGGKVLVGDKVSVVLSVQGILNQGE